MLTSTNFAVITCTSCKEVITIEPGKEFNALVHECKKKVVIEKVKEVDKKVTPKKDDVVKDATDVKVERNIFGMKRG